MASQDDGARACTTCGVVADAASRFCGMCGAALSVSGTPEGVRRHVAILFADLEGFTAMSQHLDPEVLRIVMDRYFRLAAHVVWRHGGTTEKFIGDAVMALFGVPVAREDDALRAIQAASDIIAEVDLLNVDLDREYALMLSIRVAVHAGPVSASYGVGGDFRVVGDAVNTASRLQSAAPSGEILIGEPVAQLVRFRVELEEVAPLSLKGKQAPVRAWRLVSLNAPADAAPRGTFVGREVELSQLCQTYDRSVRDGRSVIATVLGLPGIGKSRLAAELQAALDNRSLTVLSGKATSYGQGATYRPIVELLESAPRAWMGFAAGANTDPAVARAYSCLAGLRSDATESGQHAEVEEVAWALFTYAASLAAHGPVLLIWDDLHWAEATMLDVIDYLGDELDDRPVMQLCLARPELLDRRPSWSGGALGAVNLELGPLGAEETLTLVAELSEHGEVAGQIGDETCALVASACEGNPLFAELMIDLAERDSAQSLPHTIRALFAARLDQLHVDDRLVLEMAAVAGRDFLVSDIEHLLTRDDRPDIDLSSSLDRLRRTRLVNGNRLSARHTFAQAFGRDTTYELTAKRDRLRWHLALADRVRTEAAASPPTVGSRDADLLPYHLEAALSLTRELHPSSESVHDLGAKAATALAEQATYAADRKDLPAAAGLFERALLALPTGDRRQTDLAVRLSDTWLDMGDRDRALAALGQTAAGGDAPAVEIQRELIALRHGLSTPERALATEKRLEPRLGDDELSWCRFHQMQAHRQLVCEQLGAADASLAAALARAQAADEPYQQRRIMRDACQLMMWGPAPVPEGLVRCRELAERFVDSRVSLVTIAGTTGGLLALDGQFTAAREQLTLATSYAAELRMHGADIGLAHLWGVVESLAGHHESAAEHFGRAWSILREADNADGVALLDAHVGRELVAAGSPVPSRYLDMTDSQVVALSDHRTGALVASLCARAAAEAGAGDRALRLADRAGALARGTDDLFFQGTVHLDLAVTLKRVGHVERALGAANAARDRFSRKGARAALPGANHVISELACGPDRQEGSA